MLDNYLKWRLAVNIYLTKNDIDLNISKLAKNIGTNQAHPYFYEILGQLFDNEIITIVKVVGTLKFIKINHNKLAKYIDESPIYEEFLIYTKKKTGGFYIA